MWDPYSEFDKALFPNGLELHAAYWPGRLWQSMVFVVHSGSDADSIGREGTAHFTEHLLSESAGFSRELVEGIFHEFGGSVNLGCTSGAATVYGFSLPIDERILTKGLNLFGEMLFSLQLDADLEKNRRIVLEEFNYHFEADYEYDLALREKKMLYPGYFRERFAMPLGLRDSVKAIQRVDLQLFYDQHYVPKNITIVTVGGLKLYQLMDLIFQSNLEKEKLGETNPTLKPITTFQKLAENCHVFEMAKNQKSSGSYRSVARIPGNSKKWSVYFLREMINEILQREIREKRSWTYNISARNYDLGDLQEFIIKCSSLSVEAFDSIASVIDQSLTLIKDEEALFLKLKKKVLNRLPMLDLSGASLCGQAVDNLIIWQRIPTLTEWKEEIEATTFNDVTALLPWIDPAMRWTLLIKP